MMADIATYSLPRDAGAGAGTAAAAVGPTREEDEDSSSAAAALFLRILTTADYYTTNQTLMAHVPPVYVDIILDPFILDVLPRSLAPTVGYIVVVAAVAWLLARRIAVGLSNVASAASSSSSRVIIKKEQ